MTHESTASTDSSPVAVPDAARAASGSRAASRWLLLGAIVLASAALGWSIGRSPLQVGLVVVEASFAADDGSGARPVDGSSPRLSAAGNPDLHARADDVGRLKAEMLRLRVLFQRLAEAAELDDDGEFDIDYDIDAVTGDGEPLSELDPAGDESLALLIERFDPMVRQSERMARIFKERRQDYDRRLSGRPLAEGTLSSGFGRRIDPLTGEQVMHRGLDFVGKIGEPVLALADGIVTYAGPNGGYGLLVELEHVGGFKTRYAHNDTTIARLGAAVGKGESIATLGSSGRSTGPHLHLEVRHRGQATDPRFYVR